MSSRLKEVARQVVGWVGFMWPGDPKGKRGQEELPVGPTLVHVDNKDIIDGLWTGEMKCIGPKARDAHLWILIWEEVRGIHAEGILLEVEHVKADRSKKNKKPGKDAL